VRAASLDGVIVILSDAEFEGEKARILAS